MRVRDVMTPGPVTVPLDATVEEARALFDGHGFHHLLVTGPGGLEGVLSDRDLLRAASPFLDTPSERDRDRYTLRRPVHQVMTRNPVTITGEATIQVAAKRMVETGAGCLPVLSGDRLVGILTRLDLLRALVGREGGDTMR